MAKARQIQPDQPLYVRWTPDTCPYALEMRLDLITRLKVDLDQSELEGLEIGGVFFGALPTQDSPTLRLDDLIIVPGAVNPKRRGQPDEFTLDGGQIRHLAQMSAESVSPGRQFVGFFRSHLRSGPMEPTSGDKDLLTPQFPKGIYAFLMIGRKTSFTREAMFFLAMSGQLSATPSSAPFVFEESTFQSLPELPAEATEDVRKGNSAGAQRDRPIPWPAILSFALVIFLICTWTLGGVISEYLRPPQNKVDLTAIRIGNNLKITWDHSAPMFKNAAGATLVILDGNIHRELKLDPDDLKLGQISYERLSKKVYLVMIVDGPGSKLPAQTFNWAGD